MKPRNVIVIVLVAGVLGFAGYTTLLTTHPAPGVTFTSIKGEKISTTELRGRVVLVNFWATDCPTCVREMPSMVTTYNKYREQANPR
jgi:thiol-disulfide isomerase/thioredoxin